MAKPMAKPIHPSYKLDKDEQGKGIDKTKYRRMIDSLMYLTSSRLDISFSVGLCSRFQSCPKESHLLRLRGSLDIYMEHKLLVFGILE